MKVKMVQLHLPTKIFLFDNKKGTFPQKGNVPFFIPIQAAIPQAEVHTALPAAAGKSLLHPIVSTAPADAHHSQ